MNDMFDKHFENVTKVQRRVFRMIPLIFLGWIATIAALAYATVWVVRSLKG